MSNKNRLEKMKAQGPKGRKTRGGNDGYRILARRTQKTRKQETKPIISVKTISKVFSRYK